MKLNLPGLSRAIFAFSPLAPSSQDAPDPKPERFSCNLCLDPDGEDECEFMDVFVKDVNDNAPVFLSNIETNVDIREVSERARGKERNKSLFYSKFSSFEQEQTLFKDLRH